MEALVQSKRNEKQRALIGLALVGIAPTVSVVTGFALKAGMIAAVVFVLTKMWMFGLPAYWYTKVEGGERSYSMPEQRGLDGINSARHRHGCCDCNRIFHSWRYGTATKICTKFLTRSVYNSLETGSWNSFGYLSIRSWKNMCSVGSLPQNWNNL